MAHYFRIENPKFEKDCYETPYSVLDMVLEELDPQKHYIWEPFPGSGYSTKYIRSKGFKITNGPHTNFFDNVTSPQVDQGYDLVVVSNPPFSKKKEILAKLKDLKVHKIALLLPVGTLFLSYFDRLFPCGQSFSIIIHRGRVKFINPNTHQQLANSCSFDVIWVVAGLNLPKPILYKSYKDYEKY